MDTTRHPRLGQVEVPASYEGTGSQESLRKHSRILKDERLQETSRKSERLHPCSMVGQVAREVQVFRESALRHLVISDSSSGNWSRWPIFKHQKLHECPFPPELVERILLIASDPEDMVLDPFAGSGMTLAVATCMKRNFTGFEINESYVKNFWSQVVPVVKSWYLEKDAQKLLPQENMEEKLEKLKKLKFARTLSQELISELPALQPATTFLLEMGGKIDVFFVYDDTTKPLDDRIEKTANSVVTKLLEKKELKTFGIKAQTHVSGASKFIASMRDSLTLTNLWLYKRPNLFESSTKFDEWVATYNDENWRERYFMGRSPPIVSNIDIYQKEIDLSKPQEKS